MAPTSLTSVCTKTSKASAQSGVAAAAAREHVAPVAGGTGQAAQAGMVLQRGGQGLDVEVSVLEQPCQQAPGPTIRTEWPSPDRPAG